MAILRIHSENGLQSFSKCLKSVKTLERMNVND